MSVTKKNHIVCTGHTIGYGVFIPPLPSKGVSSPLVLSEISLGVEQIHQMLERMTIASDLATPCTTNYRKGNHDRITFWDLGWFPYLPGKTNCDAIIETLRIRATRETLLDKSLSWRNLGLIRSHRIEQADRALVDRTVYIYLDGSLDFQVDWFVPEKADLVILQLTSMVSEPRTSDLATFIAEIRTRARSLVIITNKRFLAATKMSLTEDWSAERFALGCLDALEPAQSRDNCGFNTSLLMADHLLVRHKTNAVVQIRGLKHHDAILHYHVNPDCQVSSASGYLYGYTAIIGASILASLAEHKSMDLSDLVHNGIRDGILRANLFDSAGFLSDDRSSMTHDLERNIKVFDVPREHLARKGSVHRISVPVGNRDWCILGSRIAEVSSREKKTRRGSALDIGRMIVKDGVKKAVLTHGIPITRFGKLTILERNAYEQVWEIFAAMRSYLATFQRERRPLCLALFGKPGGGKSFVVKELAKSLKSEILPEENVIEVNVSQYHEPRDLAWVFRRVRDITLQGQMPLVFFDEFDANRGQEAFGWQKTFLAPMQDGKFGAEPDEIVFQHGIFVFVGGVNHSFDMFNSRFRGRDFIEAKGPDFGSRLVRFLNVLGIVDDPEKPDDFGYILRRAVLVRAAIEKFQPGIFWNGIDGSAEIDVEVIDPLLLVPEFRHGVRSLEQIIRTCRLPDHRPRFHQAAFPPDSQLEMHVDTNMLRACVVADDF